MDLGILGSAWERFRARGGAGALHEDGGASEDITNIERLKSPGNFDLWNFQITNILKANGLLDIGNGKSLFEDLKDETGKDKWILMDAKAQKYIMLAIEKNVLTHILNCKTSKRNV
ncbi:hypothetical protein LAZ67_7003556 [Cordylochernes scorpioides]|uniref:Uncharacterized protein n=1 Tax=Cordylochernes scorpioides TaxID=51811 RepID=A0ABY6KP00_9ARAC|nr:hypothetical protein LAZ67_7003556 [Cordylochernes scorpioides]